MSKVIRNVDTVLHTYAGQSIAAGASYTIQATEEGAWANSSTLLSDIGSGKAIVNNGTADITDVALAINHLKDIGILDTDGYPVYRARAFNATDGFNFRGKGISGTATAGTTTDIDYKLTEERYINGCQLILNSHALGDTVTFQVVDKDNVLGYGAGVVLQEFGTTWQVSEDERNQGVFKVEYPAKILANLYVRIKYTSQGLTNVNVACNLFLHKKT